MPISPGAAKKRGSQIFKLSLNLCELNTKAFFKVTIWNLKLEIPNWDLTIANYPNIFVIGDLAHFSHQDGQPLLGVAPVAMQQGRYVANLIENRQRGKGLPAFRYVNKENLAVIILPAKEAHD